MQERRIKLDLSGLDYGETRSQPLPGTSGGKENSTPLRLTDLQEEPMFLGIHPHSGVVYEGLGSPSHAVIPAPTITRAKLIENEADWNALPAPHPNFQPVWIFREDSFDAVSRTRRGRLYYPMQGQQPMRQYVTPHPYEFPSHQAALTGQQAQELFTYQSCVELFSKPRQGQGMTLALGASGAISAWRIIQSELIASHDVLVTLKALSAYGVLPDLDLSKVPAEHQSMVKQYIDKALDAAFRESPGSVVDQCRNAMTVVLARFLVTEGQDEKLLSKDLGEIADALLPKPLELTACHHLAKAVARLHARNKGNERHARGSRSISEEDAQLALEALGFTLREIGWARV